MIGKQNPESGSTFDLSKFKPEDVASAQDRLTQRGIASDNVNYSWLLEQELANTEMAPKAHKPKIVTQFEGIKSKEIEKKFIPRPDIDD